MSTPKDFDLVFESDEFVRPPLWIIGPRSYFADRAVPLLEVSAVPARSFSKKTLQLTGRQNPSATRNYTGRKDRIIHPIRTSKHLQVDPDRYYVDLRIFGIRNWSHFLNQALPVAVFIKDHLSKLAQQEPVFILNENVFSAITELMERIGLRFIRTNRAVTASQVKVEYSDSSVIDHFARDFLSSLSGDIDALVDEVPKTSGEAVFFNRKPPHRSIVNDEEIGQLLSEAGFVEYFMEDYSAAEQIAITLRASKIVAIHGAALAPLIFRNESHGPLQLFEIVNPGHVVPLFRGMVAGLPCTYRMVRGIPDAEMVSDAFSDVANPSMQFTRKHSLKQFRLDPSSLKFAFDSVNDANFPFGSINKAI